MTDRGVPVYVRARDADNLSFRRPQYVYEARCPVWSDTARADSGMVICQLTSNVNESILWCDDDCRDMQEWTQLRKSFQSQGVSMATVWQDTDTPNLTTGRVETDPRKFATYLRERAEIDSERLGMVVDYQPVDPTDRDALGITDEGLDATHDHQVATGQKDSRGRFVFPMT